MFAAPKSFFASAGGKVLASLFDERFGNTLFSSLSWHVTPKMPPSAPPSIPPITLPPIKQQPQVPIDPHITPLRPPLMPPPPPGIRCPRVSGCFV